MQPCQVDAPIGITRFAIVDLETTGLDPVTDRIIEVAVVTVDADADGGARVTGRWESLVNPRRRVRASFVHGITDAMVASAPDFAAIALSLRAALSGRVVVAHNLAFDSRFLRAEFGRCDVPLADPEAHGVCTMLLCRRHLPPGPCGLAACCTRLGLPYRDRHTALGDAEATAGLLIHLIGRGVCPVRPALPHPVDVPDVVSHLPVTLLTRAALIGRDLTYRLPNRDTARLVDGDR